MTEKSTRQPWQAESLRLTVFRPPTAVAPESRDWWKGVVGSEPENRVESPRLNVTREDGLFLGGRLSLNVSAARIDWVIAAESNPEEVSTGLGPVEEGVERFTKALNEWLKSARPVQRLAVGVVASLGVPDRLSGYRTIQGFLQDVKLDAEHTSDFLYQINRPRQSKVIPALKINRLSKWSVSSSRTVQWIVGAAPQASLAGPEVFACRLELDINTAAEHEGELPTLDVLPELARLALEISDRGDIP